MIVGKKSERELYLSVYLTGAFLRKGGFYMKNRIVAISRQFGSGGHTIGLELAKKLDIPFYDQDIIEKIAVETGYAEEYISEKGEYLTNGGWLYNITTRSRFESNPQDRIWEVTEKVIRELAEKGPCVIVGRCADYILKDDHNLLTVYIHADDDKRSERVIHRSGSTKVPIEKRLRDKDKMRSSFYQFYTDRTWGNANNYTISLDSGVLGIDKCVEIIASLY
jgi:cytidylate kinase